MTKMQLPREAIFRKGKPGENLGTAKPFWVRVHAWNADYQHPFESWESVLRLMMFAPVHAHKVDGVLYLYSVDQGHPSYEGGRT